MHRITRINRLCFLLPFFSIIQLHAEANVKIYSMDEGLNETNISKPRIYIKNTGTEMIQDFCYYYYLTGENDSGFVLYWMIITVPILQYTLKLLVGMAIG